MSFSLPSVPTPKNEVCRSYPPGSADAVALAKAVEEVKATVHEVPLIIGGKEVWTEKKGEQHCPGDHKHILARYSMATEEHVKQAIEAALVAKQTWEEMHWTRRAAILLRTADLLTGKYRYQLNAACMLGQGKTVWQGEIDAIAETADFLRFNPKYLEEIYKVQPPENSPGCWNRVEYRPLEGFVWALSPFNFTSIGANLCTSPALMGNVVVWKPSSTAVYSNYIFMKIMMEAGLPAGVINFLPGSGALMAKVILSNPHFAGIHFTGSTAVFEDIQSTIAKNIKLYRIYPRCVGETGGKDFHFIHESADVPTAVNSTIRASFEYQGQKCSACSRVYCPDTLWESQFLPLLKSQMAKITMGEPEDFHNYVTAVIDNISFTKLKQHIDDARAAKDAEIVIGGECDSSKGWYIQPTVIHAKDPHYVTMREELFGPVVTVYVYKASEVDKALELCDTTSQYALTGSVFAKDSSFIEHALVKLRHSEGNFYINDKCTGAVVGQQPFGGARKSGTNDKAGMHLNLLRWVSVRAIKESFTPLDDFRYPHMQ
eukprot:TRINITY_DN17925_c0_g1_i1.p1 TRINITY_DN17925_c0_g1~~TRINITY_DN17925_c0_g1_i1.p1  ORF type:complete len:544 (-),score=185.61 TRINITY_DN17925_c0_g1_i1:76-1707(-)